MLLIASFLPYFSIDQCNTSDCSVSGWSPALYPLLPAVTLAGLIAAAFLIAARALPEDRRLLGISLPYWGTVTAVVTAWSAIWSLFGDLAYDPHGQGFNKQVSLGIGAYLGLVAALALAALSVLSRTAPALKAPLLPAAKPAPQQYTGQPYGASPAAGYGYPAAGQPGYAAAPQAGGPGAAGAPEPEFAPFWFAVPVTRPLYSEDGSPVPIDELAPGTWYLAVEQRGSALVAQTQTGRRGVLQDTSGIQRG
nr:hypothetical protein [Streptomyces sp. SID5468]